MRFATGVLFLSLAVVLLAVQMFSNTDFFFMFLKTLILRRRLGTGSKYTQGDISELAQNIHNIKTIFNGISKTLQTVSYFFYKGR